MKKYQYNNSEVKMMDTEKMILKMIERMAAMETSLENIDRTARLQNKLLGEIQKNMATEGKAHMMNMYECQTAVNKKFSLVYEAIDAEKKRTNELLFKYFLAITGSVVITIVLAVFRAEMGI